MPSCSSSNNDTQSQNKNLANFGGFRSKRIQNFFFDNWIAPEYVADQFDCILSHCKYKNNDNANMLNLFLMIEISRMIKYAEIIVFAMDLGDRNRADLDHIHCETGPDMREINYYRDTTPSRSLSPLFIISRRS